jgi:hypothetical protein
MDGSEHRRRGVVVRNGSEGVEGREGNIYD